MAREVLSDVHTFNNYEVTSEENVAVTRFEFCFEQTRHKTELNTKSKLSPSFPLKGTSDVTCAKNRKLESLDTADHERHVENEDFKKTECRAVKEELSETDSIVFDDDGDFTGRRKPVTNINKRKLEDESEEIEGFINIKHHLATDLQSVGEQVWLGALLLCDFMLDNYDEFTGQTVVDLGAGTGLTSLVAGLFANRVFCTDTGTEILQLAHANVENARLYPSLPLQLGQIEVRELDWFKGIQAAGEASYAFGASKEDIEAIQAAPIVIAADVVYDNAITDAFIKTVWRLLDQPINKTLYIGLEKRLVFTIEDLDVTSPGYQHFSRKLDGLLVEGKNANIEVHIEKLPSNFKQYFNYTRTKQLELWKIWTVRDVT